MKNYIANRNLSTRLFRVLMLINCVNPLHKAVLTDIKSLHIRQQFVRFGDVLLEPVGNAAVARTGTAMMDAVAVRTVTALCTGTDATGVRRFYLVTVNIRVSAIASGR